MKFPIGLVLVSILLLTNGHAVSSEAVTKLEAFSTAIEASSLRDEALARFVAAYFDTHFDRSVDWNQLSAEELEAEFKAADLAAFHTMSPVYVERMSLALARLQSHGLATPSQYKLLYGDSLLAGMYDQARQLQMSHPRLNLPPVPSITALDVSPESGDLFLLARSTDELQVVERDDSSGTEIVIISHPLCHFSARAFEAITAEGELREVFSDHAVWVVPPQRRLYTDEILEWAKQDSSQSILQAFRPPAGSIFQTRTTPTFFFIKDGEVVDKLVGWPEGGNMQALKAKMVGHGMLVP